MALARGRATHASAQTGNQRETVARETAPSDIPGYAEYLAFIAAGGLERGHDGTQRYRTEVRNAR